MIAYATAHARPPDVVRQPLVPGAAYGLPDLATLVEIAASRSRRRSRCNSGSPPLLTVALPELHM
jgi:hypothetical protein